MLDLFSPISTIPRINARFAAKLKRLEIATVKDLLWHFPSRYEDFSKIYKIADLNLGQEATIQGVIKQIVNRRSWQKKMFLTEALISDDTGSIGAIWFNQPYIRNTLKPGRLVNLAGKVTAIKNKFYLSHPAYEVVSGGETKHTGRIVAIYPETRGLTSKGIRYLIKLALDNLKKLQENLPIKILKKLDFPEINWALKQIHFPETEDGASRAKKRFDFEDLFFLQLYNLKERIQLSREQALVIETDLEQVKKIISELPFELMPSQKKSLWEIILDLKKGYPMNRLMQGDVGSGKTIVAAIGAIITAKQNYQVAFMAPTEILARQHYNTFIKFFPDFEQGIGLLTASEAKIYYGTNLETVTKKQKLCQALKNDSLKIIIGTHAVLQKNVEFANLAFVIIDEQHRFGVRQRATLVRGHTQTGRGQNADSTTRTDADKMRTDADSTTRTNADWTQTNAEETQIGAVQKPTNVDLLYGDITYKIRAACFEVRKELGLGHKEIIYQKALEEEFQKAGLQFEKEKRINVSYNNKNIGIYQPDFLIEDKIIIEIKALPFIGKNEEKQIWTYLKGSSYELALLINFSPQQVEFKRIIYEEARQGLRSSASSPRESALIPHFLSMSATPIPRTLNLTLFGDLDLSLITELPKNRKPIITKVVAPANRGKAYQFIREQIQKGRQAFVICPRIEPQTDADRTQTNADWTRTYTEKTQTDVEEMQEYADGLPRSSALSLRESALLEVKSVKEEYEKLTNKIFPDLKIAMLHGKMKAKEKESIMRDFKDNKTHILVATSVIEVGIDVPNATIMFIEGAERFGLAQLYQFRGRVGRGEHQSFCFLFTESESRITRERLKSITEAKNGLELAEKDLKIRGPGEFLGEIQTGMPDIAMKALKNPQLAKSARESAKEILREDVLLQKYPFLLEQLEQFRKNVHWE